ncbi:hypothetical protein JCM10908_006648 [Rhodotorula pacifica]|uniref:uncharacterized protein n=1 Tax=Rhodotorula pacifica TaxID=1495444 RepID=UPI003170DAB5
MADAHEHLHAGFLQELAAFPTPAAHGSDDEDIAPQPAYPTEGTYLDKVDFVYRAALACIDRLYDRLLKAADRSSETAIAAAEAWQHDVLSPNPADATLWTDEEVVKSELRGLNSRITRMQFGRLVPWPSTETTRSLSLACQNGNWVQREVCALVRDALVKIHEAVSRAKSLAEESAASRRSQADAWRTKMLGSERKYSGIRGRGRDKFDTNLKFLLKSFDGMVLAQHFSWPASDLFDRNLGIARRGTGQTSRRESGTSARPPAVTRQPRARVPPPRALSPQRDSPCAPVHATQPIVPVLPTQHFDFDAPTPGPHHQQWSDPPHAAFPYDQRLGASPAMPSVPYFDERHGWVTRTSSGQIVGLYGNNATFSPQASFSAPSSFVAPELAQQQLYHPQQTAPQARLPPYDVHGRQGWTHQRPVFQPQTEQQWPEDDPYHVPTPPEGSGPYYDSQYGGSHWQ